MTRTRVKQHNIWKWAFLLLVLLIVLLSSWLAFQVFTPRAGIHQAEATNPQTSLVKEKPIYEVQLTPKQVQRIANHYIEQYLNSDDLKYSLQIGHRVNLLGSVRFLGSNINFELQTTPYKTTTGGVQLKVEHLKVGKLGIPVEFVMTYIKNNYRVPLWVQVNSKRQLININLEQYHTGGKNDFFFKIKRINLPQKQILVEGFTTKF